MQLTAKKETKIVRDALNILWSMKDGQPRTQEMIDDMIGDLSVKDISPAFAMWGEEERVLLQAGLKNFLDVLHALANKYDVSV